MAWHCTDVPLDDAAEISVREQLAELGIDHEILPCDPGLADTAQFCAAYGVDPADSANTIVVIGKSEPPVYVACVVLAPTRLDVNNTVRRRLGVRKASFASGDQTNDLTGMMIGGVTAFGLPSDMPVWIDRRVMERPSVVLGGGSRSCKIRCEPSALLAIPSAEVIDDLALDPADLRSESSQSSQSSDSQPSG
jgi:prolyl-tRNA editing enzyme YbaK/EbsC (Cys-tRNA(Pro) deacylase)